MPDRAPTLQITSPLKRGGHRNWADRTSLQLTEGHCVRLMKAPQVAMSIGQPLNRFITIAWEKCGIAPQQSVLATGAWIILAREWLRRRDYSTSWAWVQESGPRIGAHCHILFHVPPSLDPLFRGRPGRWARKVVMSFGGQYARGTMQTQKLRFSNASDADADAYRTLVMGKVHYMLKCAPAHLEGPLFMDGHGPKPWGQRCLVYGKRLALWQAAGLFEDDF